MSFPTVRVMLRINDDYAQENNKISVLPNKKDLSLLLEDEVPQEFQFHHIFDSTTLELDLYNQVGSALVDNVLNGNNSTFLAYGSYDSGKNFTLFGDASENDTGVIKRSLRDLFRKIEEKHTENEPAVSLSYYEIYNKKIRDLGNLQITKADYLKQNLELRDFDGQICIDGLAVNQVKNYEEIDRIIEHGFQLRFANRADTSR